MDVRHGTTWTNRPCGGIHQPDTHADAWKTQALLDGRRLKTTRRALENLNRAYGVLESGMVNAANHLATMSPQMADALSELALTRSALVTARSQIQEKDRRIAELEHESLIAGSKMAGVAAVLDALSEQITDSPLATPTGPDVFSRGRNAGQPKSMLVRIFEQAFDAHFTQRSGRSDARDHRPD